MTTINNMEDLIRILEERPEWRAAARGLIVGEELAQLPGRVIKLEESLAAFIQATDRNFQLVHQRLERLESEVAGLKEGQARLESEVAGLKEGQTKLEEGQARLEEGQARLDATQRRMSGQLGNLIGSNFERQASRLAPRYVRRLLGLSRTEVVYSFTDNNSVEFKGMLDSAVEAGVITEDEADELRLTDLVLAGQDQQGQRTYVVLEISVTARQQDADRALERVGILGKAAGLRALPVVMAATRDEDALQPIDFRGVPLLVAPED